LSARNADRVVVVEHGRIVEVGSPSLLVRNGSLFAAWVELETAGWNWETPPPSARSDAAATSWS
jgi:ABC-type transport system involved in cytochrome bd biosynthesis fused ATPase/permease subunit